MQIDEIRANAPDGATHYNNYGSYFMIANRKVCAWIDGRWGDIFLTKDLQESMKPLN